MHKRNLLKWITLLIVLPALVATLCTRAQWGYFFFPPPVDPLLPAAFDSIGYYGLDITSSGAVEAFNITEERQLFALEYPNNRPAQAAAARGLAITPLSDDMLARATEALQATGWRLFVPDMQLADAERRDDSGVRSGTVQGRFISFALPRGYIIEGRGDDGAPLVFISITSMNAVDGNDDTYSYFEALYEDSGSALLLRGWQTFQYDIAGFEFAQWPFWFAAVLLLMGGIFLIVTPARALLRRRRRRGPAGMAAPGTV